MNKKSEFDQKTKKASTGGRTAREDRLARSLRANLKKRKDQMRQRRVKNELVKDSPTPERW